MSPRKLTRKPGYSFPGPIPKDALDYFKAKDLRVGFDYRDVWGQEHVHAFTVAKMVQLDLLDAVRDAVEVALEKGQTFRQFSKELTPIVQQGGWWGRAKRLDPKTGKKRRVQLGSPRRLRTIYQANMRSARAAGQWARIQRTKTTHPYLLYQLGPSETHRAQHAAWAGTLLPSDDPWWEDHFPPNGWGCKCWVRAVSRREAERVGGVTACPVADPVEWTNKRTGEALTVDRGLDPAWARNSGRDRDRILQDQLARRIDQADQELAHAAVRRVVESRLLDRHLVPGRRGGIPKGDLPIAVLEQKWKKHLESATQVVRLTERIAEKLPEKHPELTLGDYRDRLGRILRDEQVIVEETGHQDRPGPDLVFFHDPSGRFDRSSKLWKAVVAKRNDRHLYLATFHRSNLRDLRKTMKCGRVILDQWN